MSITQLGLPYRKLAPMAILSSPFHMALPVKLDKVKYKKKVKKRIRRYRDIEKVRYMKKRIREK